MLNTIINHHKSMFYDGEFSQTLRPSILYDLRHWTHGADISCLAHPCPSPMFDEQHIYKESPFPMGKPSINGVCSIAMLIIYPHSLSPLHLHPLPLFKIGSTPAGLFQCEGTADLCHDVQTFRDTAERKSR